MYFFILMILMMMKWKCARTPAVSYANKCIYLCGLWLACGSFGAKIMSRSTGIILNNVMGDFSAPNITNYFGLPPSPANFIQPGKRPLSSMCPAVFVDKRGDVVLVIGAAGGTRITSGTSLVSLRNLWLKEDIKTAIDEKRIHHQLFPQQLLFEKGFNEDMLVALEKLGHATKQYETGGPIVVAISRAPEEF